MNQFRETPAGRERGDLTGRIMDHHDQEYAREVLEEKVGGARVVDRRRVKRMNGGGALTVRDLCAELSNTDLAVVARKLGV